MALSTPMEMTVNVKIDEPEIRFALMIGRLDRLLSEIMIAAARPDIDEADRQTLKHHADDLIGVGNAVLRKLQITTQTELPLDPR